MATIARRYIKDMESSEFVSGIYCISNAQLGRTKTDKPYLKCLLRDKSGEMAARMWTIDQETFKRLPQEGFVYIEGETQAYQGDLQLIVRQIEPADPGINELRELLPVSENDPEKMFAEVVSLLETLEHPAMKALARVYLDDKALMDAFKMCPAAKQMHHAYIGGLLEHTLNLLRLAAAITPLYPQISRDVVLMGLFLHDLGKTRELVWDRAFTYSDRGELIGHIVEGAIMLHDRAQLVMRATGQRLPKHAITVLQHIILSHHEKPEYGAARIPSTPEAIMVAMLDNLDAKMDISGRAVKASREGGESLGGNFTDKQWALESTKLFKPDPLGE
jgi:3'-5' exoribonuclease